MGQFRKKPIVVEAWRFNRTTDGDFNLMPEWLEEAFTLKIATGGDLRHPLIAIQTLEGTMIASIGDWIIRGVEGEIYPCKPYIFEATYEPVI